MPADNTTSESVGVVMCAQDIRPVLAPIRQVL